MNPGLHSQINPSKETAETDFTMAKWAAGFLLTALFAGLLGFTGAAGVAADAVRLLFFLCTAFLIITFLFAAYAGRRML
jgi:uncharacterized membrane protein YtjA (UPF0391 family)